MGTEADAPAVASVAKAARVLKAFTPTVRSLSVRQLAARTELPRSTVHALCRTLAQTGLLETSPAGYQLGPVVLELGGQVIERTGLVQAAEGVLKRLLRSPEEEVHLGQLSLGWIIYLDREAGTHRLPMLNRVGQRAPAHLTGCGKAALSWLPSDEVDDRVQHYCEEERREPPDLEALHVELASGQEQGYVVSRSFQQNRTSVAAAIFDSARRPVGGVSIAGPAGMFTAAVLKGAQASVVDTAGLISARLMSPTLS